MTANLPKKNLPDALDALPEWSASILSGFVEARKKDGMTEKTITMCKAAGKNFFLYLEKIGILNLFSFPFRNKFFFIFRSPSPPVTDIFYTTITEIFFCQTIPGHLCDLFIFTFEFFSGYKYFLLPQKVQKKTIYGFTVNDLFIANIQFISFCFHNLVSLLLLQLLQLLYNPYFPLISEITSSAFR